MRCLLLAAALALPMAGAQAQTERPEIAAPEIDDAERLTRRSPVPGPLVGEPEAEEGLIYSPGSRISRVQDPELTALARRLANATQEPEIGQALSDRVAEVEEAGEPPPGFGRNPTPDRIVAYSPLKPPTRVQLEMHEWLIDRIARFYAATYQIGELRRLVDFFESPVGRKFRERRRDMIADARAALRSPEFQAELREAACRADDFAGPVDGPHHGYVRLLPVESGRTPRPPARCSVPTAEASRD